jgi:nicotinamidase/pyrazinamidase
LRDGAQVIFWDVDTQVDFMEPGGKLYVPGAEQIIPRIQRLNSWAASHGILVVASMCAHHPSDPEFADYPPHCLVGTPGQQKVPGTVLPKHLIVPNQRVELPRELSPYQQIVIEKQATDVFTNPNVDALLQLLGRDRRVVLYGVVTEICLEKAARGLVQRGYGVDVVGDAVRHLDGDKGRGTIEYVLNHGGRELRTEEVTKLAG